MKNNFTTAARMLELCNEYCCKIGELMLLRECELEECGREAVLARLERAYRIMCDAVKLSQTEEQRSMGGLIGGEAIRLRELRAAGGGLCGDVVGDAVGFAMGTLEVNASMGLIVAAPTAGASGVLPGVLLSLQRSRGFDDSEVLMALACAGAIGYLLARNATIAGAEGGCQAEVGSASAMAAAAAVQLSGGTPLQCCNAAGAAISNLLGLVCDPIRGLVESPCQGRNAIGAANALVCAELALANATHALPLDEVIGAMYAVGKSMPRELRETALGGIAACASAAACGGCK